MHKQILIVLLFLGFNLQAKETITFRSSDGLLVTADLYITNPIDSPFIILCHQANWSRGEYLEIAPKLNAIGYNCMAIDQRSGGAVNGVVNETKKRAKAKGLGLGFADAEIDIVSAINYVKQNYSETSKTILWGSCSYSASLSLRLAGERQDLDAVLAFAPGEYFKRSGKPSNYIEVSAQKINIPVFITSKKTEKPNWWAIYEVIPFKQKQYFLPQKSGQHGSRALWEKFEEHQDYWKAVKTFLKTV